MPLIFAKCGQQLKVTKIVAEEKVKRHLADMGITSGSDLYVSKSLGGDMVIIVKNCRIALNRQLAMNIFVA